MKQKLFTLLLAVAAGVGTMFAEKVQIGDLYYNLDATNQTAEVTSQKSDYPYWSTSITTANIPASVTYNEVVYSVTSIGYNAFYGCSGLISVAIPNSVTSIGWGAFYNCSGLTSVTIPNSVTSIGDYAFDGCTGLTSVTIPNSVTSIGNGAFQYCSGFPVIDNIRYADTYLIEAVDKTLSTYTIKDGTKWIGCYAFSGCRGLTSVTIPNSVTSFGNYAFENCTGLTSIEIPNSVTSIGGRTFYNCTGLTSVTIPNSVTSIGDGAFYYCTGLTSVTIPNSVTSFGSAAFYMVNNIVYSGSTRSYYPWGAKSVNGYVEGYLVYNDATKTKLLGCSSAVNGEIVIPNSVTSIGNYAFERCSGLTSVTIPNSVPNIGDCAFKGCTGLTSVVWNAKNCADFIGNDTPFYSFNNKFDLRSQITSFTFGDEVEHIPSFLCFGMPNLTSVTIPNSVTSIGGGAFRGCTGLTSVTIPNSVTNIGGGAFSGCTGLTSVSIGNSVTNIESDAFENSGVETINFIGSIEDWCNKIWSPNCISSNYQLLFNGVIQKNVIIPSSVTSIGNNAFSGCTGLTSVTIPNSVTSIGNNVFSGCNSLTSVAINSPDIVGKTYTSFSNIKNIFGSQVTQYIIGNDVTSIGRFAFSGCSGLTSVTIGNSVTSIGDYAFDGCTGLTSVTIPNSVTSIGDYAFRGCSSLTSVRIGNSVTSIGFYAFRDCTGLTSVTVNSNSVIRNNLQNIFGPQVTQYIIGSDITSIPNTISKGYSNLTSIVVESGNSTYDSRNDCNAIIETATNSLISGCKNTVIPNSVTSIGNNAFYGCSGLTSLTIPNSVTSIGESAFENCSGLTSVTIPNSVTNIGGGAFRGCSGLTSVTIPNSVTSIGYQAFYDCTGLTSVTIPNSVTSIGGSAFSRCSGLTSVEIPNSVTSIGDNAFYYCTGLTSVTIPNSVTSIGGWAFSYCSGLTSVTIPNSVTSIGDGAFRDCRGLASVTIPNSVTRIGSDAFRDCTGLTSVTCLAPTPPTCLFSSFFSGVNCSNIPLYVPMESVSLYQAANIWKEFNVIGVMFADEVETAVFSATPTDDYGVILEWQAVENAVLYNIDIIQGNDTIRKLQFDSNGKLLNNPSNVPSRYANIRYSSTAILSGNGWRCEVNDLDPGTNYTYSITVKAENGSVLYTQSIGFTTKEETFIIKFVNWNGEELLVLPEVVKGTTPSYTGETPVRPNTAEYTYTFVGWTPAIVAATSDTTYTATYTATKNSYTITWQNEDGSLIDQTTVEYGVVPTHAEPTKEATEEYTYTFAGWTPAVVAVTGDATYKATFSSVVNVYTISVSAVNGQVIGGGEYQYGATIDLTAIPNEGYVFDQWSDGVTDNPRTITVTGDVEYTALFKSAEGLENIYTSEPVQKVIIDQKVFILRGEKVYTLQGQEVK